VDTTTCILIPTFADYLGAARLSLRLLASYWPEHPDAFLCGVDPSESAMLPLRADPADWMAIVRDAVADLRARGYERAYLILDDQGPMGLCHVEHLQRTIPRWMSELDAAYISIRGWDHRRNARGKSLGRSYLHLQRQDPQFVWRFALHPALWRLDALAIILDLLMGPRGCSSRSIWAFEREAGLRGAILPKEINQGTYRVCGRLMSVEPAPRPFRALRHFRDGLLRAVDTRLRDPRTRVQDIIRRLSPLLTRALALESVFYDGPYPMHYSGFLVKGVVNPHLRRYLERRGEGALLKDVLAVAPG
jgi:hypothetical protein